MNQSHFFFQKSAKKCPFGMGLRKVNKGTAPWKNFTDGDRSEKREKKEEKEGGRGGEGGEKGGREKGGLWGFQAQISEEIF